MTEITNFADAHQALRAFYASAEKDYSLSRMHKLMEHFGNPQDELKIIHVAGTSGKTSTAYYIAGLLTAAGLKTGLTVSPHVDEINERVQINLNPLDESQFCAAFDEFVNEIRQLDLKPSYFEVMVAFAYWYFRREAVDVAIIEVGLGGLKDGTNIVTRTDKLCVITDIGLDHTQVLGNTLGEIAEQKAGIVLKGNSVFMYEQSPEVMTPIKQRVEEFQADLHFAGLAVEPAASKLPLFQQRNFQLALDAATFWLQREGKPELSPEQIEAGADTYIPARMEQFEAGDYTVILDGAHNGQKMAALIQSIRARYPDEKVSALVAFVSDADSDRMKGALDVLMTCVDNLIITAFTGEQDSPKVSVSPEAVAEYCKSKSFNAVSIEGDPQLAYEKLQQSASPILLVTGSFYLLNHIRPLMLKA